MGLDKLAVIFVIIILPISVLLSEYTTAQVDVLKLQSMYDTKLYSSTYDAVKAYQLNTFNEDTSDLANSRLRLVKASANAFFTSLASNLSMNGYTKSDLEDYVPALVFTMYDGYYIYSKYTNTLTGINYNYTDTSLHETYEDGEQLYGVKPYIYYSCRYSRGADDDFVITYSLDNFISIQGTIDGKPVNDCGNLIDITKINIDSNSKTNKTLTYNGYTIRPEHLEEYVGDKLYTYHKVNGKKYYYDDTTNKWFFLLNGVKDYTTQTFDEQWDYSAFNYYYDAFTFTQRICNSGKDLDGRDCYNLSAWLTPEYSRYNQQNRNPSDEFAYSKRYTNVGHIFPSPTSTNHKMEESDSNFNQHRIEVIRNSIEKNLSIAIANFNTENAGSSTSSYDFRMPELKESEWDKILSNMSIISFLQGMPLGFKIYNGCCVISNNKNNEAIAEESIYIATNGYNSTDETKTGTYYKPTSTQLISKVDGECTGVLNTDFERRSFTEDGAIFPTYYYPKFYLADYKSIVKSSIEVQDFDVENGIYDIYDFFKDQTHSPAPEAARAYFTALGRERYSMYNVHKDTNTLMNKYLTVAASTPPTISFNGTVVKNWSDNGHDYYLVKHTGGITWEDANRDCRNNGGHLVCINNAAEQSNVKSNISSLAATDNVWIGLYSGNRTYYSGSTIDHTNIELKWSGGDTTHPYILAYNQTDGTEDEYTGTYLNNMTAPNHPAIDTAYANDYRGYIEVSTGNWLLYNDGEAVKYLEYYIYESN